MILPDDVWIDWLSAPNPDVVRSFLNDFDPAPIHALTIDIGGRADGADGLQSVSCLH